MCAALTSSCNCSTIIFSFLGPKFLFFCRTGRGSLAIFISSLAKEFGIPGSSVTLHGKHPSFFGDIRLMLLNRLVPDSGQFLFSSSAYSGLCSSLPLFFIRQSTFFDNAYFSTPRVLLLLPASLSLYLDCLDIHCQDDG